MAQRLPTTSVRTGPPYGKVGNADCFLFPARDIVDFGIAWLERRHTTR
tara:strand:- start:528 stop:671 length:144 start_codon:yes stop_codon:yes gene_type:complete